MSARIEYCSPISCYIAGFIEEKKSLGYKYLNESKWMKKFDDYWISNGYGKTGLTMENLSGWVMKREQEGAKCLATRISVTREFSRYLNGIGVPSFCPPTTVRYEKPVIHLMSSEEISGLFTEIDGYVPERGDTHVRRMANEYPVLFRLIFLNGLRASEACLLSLKNVDLDARTIAIIDGKGHTDRLVYLSEDMADLCRKYLVYLTRELGREPEWLFPGMDPSKPMSYGSVSRRFRECWSRTSYSKGCGRNPTTHCLRHSYVVMRINAWMEQGIDFDHMLPYLSRHLGHKDFSNSYYYYHYAEKAARIIRAKDTSIGRVVPEVMRR